MRGKNLGRLFASVLVTTLAACEGPIGPQGDTGPQGNPGSKGDPGAAGQNGDAGATGFYGFMAAGLWLTSALALAEAFRRPRV